jgi:hypothetical protein
MAQFSNELLDSFVAPELSKLTRVGAPALDTQPDYLRVAFMNHVFGLRYKRKALLHVSITFLKRTMTATDEYRAGRESLTRYIDCLSRQAHDLKAYLSALSHFEQCIGSVYQCVELFDKVNTWLVPSHPRAFSKGDGSDLQRINELNNILKHFTPEQAEKTSAPVWITDTGLSSATHCVSFDELAVNIKALWGVNRVIFVEIPSESRAVSAPPA